MKRSLLLASLILAVCGCARLQPRATVGEYLDDETGVSVVYLDQPAVFYRERPALAAHARDYLSVGPLKLSQAGNPEYLLWTCRWSTIDRRVPLAQAAPDLTVVLDGRPMQLAVTRLRRLGRLPYSSPVNGGEINYYRLSRSQMLALGAATSIEIYAGSGRTGDEYRPWQDAVPALAAFSYQLDGVQPVRIANTNE